MADLGVEFCDLYFKNPIIVSSIEATNSLDRLKACIDRGGRGYRQDPDRHANHGYAYQTFQICYSG
jgi:hypothetical protein